MNKKEKIELIQKYLLYANAIDHIGFHREAEKIDKEALLVFKSEILGNKNVKVAIRGQSDLEEYMENIISGAGTGAGGAIGTGVGAPFAGVSAIAGAGLGGLQQFIRDAYFNKIFGRISKTYALTKDLFRLAQSVAQVVSVFDPASADHILYLAQSLKTQSDQNREYVRRQLSKKYGLDPRKGLAQSLTPWNWGKALRRNIELTKASKNNSMEKTAVKQEDPTSFLTNPEVVGINVTRKSLNVKDPLTKKIIPTKLTGLQGAGGLAGGLVGGMVSNYGYNTIMNKLKGQSGILRKQIDDIQRIGAALSKINEDPAPELIANQIADLSRRTLMEVLRYENPNNPHFQEAADRYGYSQNVPMNQQEREFAPIR